MRRSRYGRGRVCTLRELDASQRYEQDILPIANLTQRNGLELLEYIVYNPPFVFPDTGEYPMIGWHIAVAHSISLVRLS